MITRLITSSLLIAFGIIILRYAIAKKRYFKPIVKYIVIVYSIIAITLGVLTLLCQTYEGYGTICLGIACCMFAYQDMKEHPVSKWTKVKKKIGTVLLMYRTLDRRFDVITS